MLVILFALLLSATPAFADPGDLDPSFGTAVSLVWPSVAGLGRHGRAVVQADGKVVTVGGSDGGDFAIGVSGPTGRWTGFSRRRAVHAVLRRARTARRGHGQPDGSWSSPVTVAVGRSWCGSRRPGRLIRRRLRRLGGVDVRETARLIAAGRRQGRSSRGTKGLGTWVVRRAAGQRRRRSRVRERRAVARATLGLVRVASTASRWTATGRVLLAGRRTRGRPCCGSPQTGGATRGFGRLGVWSALSELERRARVRRSGAERTVLVGVVARTASWRTRCCG